MHSPSDRTKQSRLNLELNLVPFIDLLSTLVLFLLITAVWWQMGAVQVNHSANNKASTHQTQAGASEKLLLNLHLSSTQLEIQETQGTLESKQSFSFEKVLPVNELRAKLQPLVSRYAAHLVISVANGVTYSTVISLLDFCRSLGFESPGLNLQRV